MRPRVRRNKSADAELDAERKEIIAFIKRSSGSAQERAIDEAGANFYAMVYQSAAHSMAALGMLAPMFESMFYQRFQGIRRHYYESTAVIPSNSSRPDNDPKVFWDCHKCYDSRTKRVKQSMVDGTIQLAEVIDLKKHLPDGLTKTIEALFTYRNFMFHDGFEWPTARCKAFDKRIEEGGWQSWFLKSTRGDAPDLLYDRRIHRPLPRHDPQTA